MGLVEKVKELLHKIMGIEKDTNATRLLIGSLLAKNVSKAKSLKEAEFKVFSQCGDDGIIQFLLTKLAVKVDKFVEFGVENYEESNTRFLLMNNNWRGLIIDGSQSNINYVKKDPIYWRYDLTAVHSFITTENINQILVDNDFSGKIGILSIDIDGNDYWVWQAIENVDPDIVIIEYNSMFGSERAITVPYKPDFNRMNAHYSGLYFGASLQAICDLAHKKGYAFIGCNQTGNNAYFVKNDLLGTLNNPSTEEGFVMARFRESRDHRGKLTFANESLRKKEISGLPVINTRTGELEAI